MKRRMKKLDNKGYTLVELIIVIAIIVVLTGAATLTVGTINSARAREAAITFESELATLHAKAKGRACDSNADGVLTSDEINNDNYGIRVYKKDSRIYVQQVIIRNGSYVSVPAFEEANNGHNGKGTRLPANVYCTYTPNGGSEKKVGADGDAVIIVFTKSGRCAKGYGDFKFYRSNGDEISEVTINKNGSYKSN